MSNYESLPLGELGKIVTGKTPKTENPENFGTDYMFIGPTDLHKHFFITNAERMISAKGMESIKGSILNGVSVLVGCIGWDMGNVGVVEGKCASNQQINSITNIHGKYNPLYIYYWLKTKKDFLYQQASVTRTPILNKTDFSSIKINLPKERKYQDKVVDLLSAIDKKIELNNRINAELEAMAKTLYDYWFVQFDFPDSSPQGQGKPYKTSGGKMVYNPILKREIPEGWEDCLLGDYVTFKRGISYKSSDIQDVGVPFLNLNSFSLSGEFKQAGTKYFNGKFKSESKLNAGELVIAITDVTRNADIIGKAFVIPDIFDEKPLISCDVACVSSETFGVAYLEQLFNSDSYHKYIKHFASGTLVLHLDLQGVKWFKTHLPPSNLLEKFNQHCDSLFKQRDIVLKENVYLESLRDWLLPMLMNGQVTVK